MLQIWITPRERGLEPSYTEWKLPENPAKKQLFISPDGRDNSAAIAQDAFVYRVKLEAGESILHELAEDRGIWIQVVKGSVALVEAQLEASDGASTETPGEHKFTAGSEGVELLLFDLG